MQISEKAMIGCLTRLQQLIDTIPPRYLAKLSMQNLWDMIVHPQFYQFFKATNEDSAHLV
jgi:hypothetical protein